MMKVSRLWNQRDSTLTQPGQMREDQTQPDKATQIQNTKPKLFLQLHWLQAGVSPCVSYKSKQKLINFQWWNIPVHLLKYWP